jgi:hypothetical protein
MKQTVQKEYLKIRRKENKVEKHTTNLIQGRLRAKCNIANILKYGTLQWVWYEEKRSFIYSPGSHKVIYCSFMFFEPRIVI